MKKTILYISVILFTQSLIAQPQQAYGDCLNKYQQLTVNKKYAEAIPYAKCAAAIVKQQAGEKENNYAVLMNATGTLYFFLAKYDSARAYYDTTLQLYKTYHATDKQNILQTYINLAMCCDKMTDYSNAQKWYELVVGLKKEMYGEQSESYRTSYAALANIYKKIGKYEVAEDMMIDNVEYYKKNKPNTESHEIALENLASLYKDWGLYYWAAKFYFRTAVTRLNFTNNNDKYYKSYIANATYYFEVAGGQFKQNGDYEKAEECYASNVTIFYSQKNNKEYARFLNLKGLMQLELSNYADAEISLFASLQIFKKEFDSTHLSIGMVSNNIGSLNMAIGQYPAAEYYYAEGYRIRKMHLKETDKDLAESLSNLGNVHVELGNYAKAENFFLLAIAVYEKAGTKNSLDYSVAINNLAALYVKQKTFDKAETYYLQSLAIRERLLGKTHPSYARILNNLGTLYLSWKKPKQAKEYFTKAVAIIEQNFGKQHKRYITYANNLALCNNDLGNYQEAKQQLLETNKSVAALINKNFTILSEYEKEDYADELKYNAKFANSVLYNSKVYNKETLIDNFNQQLQLKAMVLAETKSLYDFIRNSTDTALVALFNKYSSYKNAIAKEYGLPMNERSKNLTQWEHLAEVIEKDLLLKSSQFRQKQSEALVSFQSIQNNLQNDEVAIEFVKFNLYNKGETDSAMYVAYIVTKQNDAPLFVPLFEKKQLQKILDSAGKNSQAIVSKLYRGVSLSKKSNQFNYGNALYSLIWQPLEPYIAHAKKIHFSPVDQLNSIAFNALTVDSSTYLIDKYKLFQYTSTRMLAIQNQTPATSKNITLFGNANFNLDKAVIQSYQAAADSVAIKRGFNKGNSATTTWDALPGTAEEIKNIQQLFVSKNLSTTVYANQYASEENFKKLDGQANGIVHIATHGFFLPKIDNTQKIAEEKNTTSYNTANDPMLRNGIVLSGANYAWGGGYVPKNKEDGIVTAYEIAQLNLTKTNLVVLSACETALGDIYGNEGVYGLQRAFKLAGAKNLIISLWQVPDKETAELMNTFYANYLSGNTVKEAFNKAQNSMRKKYSPFYWAAFILVE